MTLSNETFENLVRDTARHLWPQAEFSGSTKDEGRERDGVFVTDEMVHLIESTTSRSKDKAEQDTKKLATLAKSMQRQYPMKGVKGFFITRDEPTADQREAVRRLGDGLVFSLSLAQFRRQMIDSESYLECRIRYQFGSMFDRDSESRTETPDLISPQFVTTSGYVINVREVEERLSKGDSFVLVGDYGAGKSTALREIFVALRSRFFSNRQTGRFPVHLNLRDHHGQTNPAEALERHARNIGFQSPTHLVRAWHAGYLILILDGFDEFATVGWSGQAKRLRDVRFTSMELIRNFLRGPADTGIVIAGRQHYFDSDSELARSLGLRQDSVRLYINDFDENQIREFLAKKGWSENIPDWFPSRPLLLSYLFSRGMLEQVVSVGHGTSPAAGWNIFLELTADRESEIEAGIDGPMVRQIVENLATKARNKNDGMTALSQDDILGSFQSVCGFLPDDRGILLLQRLPGLGASSSDDGSRDFIDADLVDAARAGDVYRFVEDPFTFHLENPGNWQATLGQLGTEVASLRCHNMGFGSGKLRTAINEAGKGVELGALCMDLIQMCKEMGFGFAGRPIAISNTMIQDASFGEEELDFSQITFHDCLFQRLEITSSADPELLPRFHECYVGTLDGRIARNDLPEETFDSRCVIDSFGDSSQNTAAILALPLSTGVRVMLTLLKKLYLQPGAGRKQSALFRGLDHRSRVLVPEVLQLLSREGLTVRSSVGEEAVWLPVRNEGVRARRLVSSPISSNDRLIQLANSIS